MAYYVGKKKGPMKPSPDQKLTAFIKSLGLKNPVIIDITRENGLVVHFRNIESLMDFGFIFKFFMISVLNLGISEELVQCTLEEKDYYLYYILRVHSGKKMIFCNSINCVKRLHRLLNIVQMNAKILFAGMDQKQRLKNLEW